MRRSGVVHHEPSPRVRVSSHPQCKCKEEEEEEKEEEEEEEEPVRRSSRSQYNPPCRHKVPTQKTQQEKRRRERGNRSHTPHHGSCESASARVSRSGRLFPAPRRSDVAQRHEHRDDAFCVLMMARSACRRKTAGLRALPASSPSRPVGLSACQLAFRGPCQSLAVTTTPYTPQQLAWRTSVGLCGPRAPETPSRCSTSCGGEPDTTFPFPVTSPTPQHHCGASFRSVSFTAWHGLRRAVGRENGDRVSSRGYVGRPGSAADPPAPVATQPDSAKTNSGPEDIRRAVIVRAAELSALWCAVALPAAPGPVRWVRYKVRATARASTRSSAGAYHRRRGVPPLHPFCAERVNHQTNTARGSRLAARGSRLAARGSRLAARGSRLTAHGSRRVADIPRPPPPGAAGSCSGWRTSWTTWRTW